MQHLTTLSQAGGVISGPASRKADATWANAIKELTPIVHPDVSKPRIVVADNVACAARERVRRSLAEYMADMRARYNEQCTTTHPHLVRRNGTITSLNITYTTALSLCHRFCIKIDTVSWVTGIGMRPVMKLGPATSEVSYSVDSWGAWCNQM